MTGKADFTPQERELVLEGPPSAGMIVVTAQRGGTIRETLAIAKAYVEARQQHGESELLNEIVAAKPEVDHTRYDSLKSSSSRVCNGCATRSDCLSARQGRTRSRPTGGSCSRSRTGWPTLTGRAERP